MGNENQEKKAFNRIPYKEVFVIVTMLVAIGGAWATANNGISNNTKATQGNTEQIGKLEEKIDHKMDKLENRLNSSIRENRRLLLKLLQRR